MEETEVRCKMVVWSLSDIKLDKGTCDAKFRVTLFWAPPASHAAAIRHAHVLKHGAAAVGQDKTQLHWDSSLTAHDYTATYNSAPSAGTLSPQTASSSSSSSSLLSPSLSPLSSSSSASSSLLQVEFPKLSIMNADLHHDHETSEKVEVEVVSILKTGSHGGELVMRYTRMVRPEFILKMPASKHVCLLFTALNLVNILHVPLLLRALLQTYKKLSLSR